MSFWTGFATGLAKSVDTSLQNAMDKRDKELSRAKTFWQQRQAQKLDQKEAYDERAENALKRMIREAGGDVTLGLAAYNAAGGDADSVESYIKSIDKTRELKGDFDLLDNLDLQGYKKGDIVTEESAALQSVRKQMKGIDASNIQIDDPLSKIGLGLRGGAAEKIAGEINSMIEPEVVESISNIPGVKIDRSNMVDAEMYRAEVAKNAPNLDQQLEKNITDILKLDKTSDTYQDDLFELESQQATILAAKSAAQAIEDGVKNKGTKLTEFMSLHRVNRDNAATTANYSPPKAGVAASARRIGPDGIAEQLTGVAATEYYQQELQRENIKFIKNNLIDENGDFVSSDAEAMVNGYGDLNDAYTIVKREIAEAKAAGDTGSDADEVSDAASAASSAAAANQQKQNAAAASKYGTPQSLASQKASKAATAEDLLNVLKIIFPDSDPAALKNIADTEFAKAKATKSAAATELGALYADPPMPLTNLTPGSNAYNEWLATYGDTHNPDGTRK
jgi:hypothetical protein|tara:strand:- start:378 stop:1898 length:1521 start_codon:yes stop_codon:yes gene_type:complete